MLSVAANWAAIRSSPRATYEGLSNPLWRNRSRRASAGGHGPSGPLRHIIIRTNRRVEPAESASFFGHFLKGEPAHAGDKHPAVPAQRAASREGHSFPSARDDLPTCAPQWDQIPILRPSDAHKAGDFGTEVRPGRDVHAKSATA